MAAAAALCKHILLKGERKGLECAKKCKLGHMYCTAHASKYVVIQDVREIAIDLVANDLVPEAIVSDIRQTPKVDESIPLNQTIQTAHIFEEPEKTLQPQFDAPLFLQRLTILKYHMDRLPRFIPPQQ